METIMSGFSRAMLLRDLGSEGFHRRIAGALRRGWLSYIDWRVRRLAIHRLSGMSDRELKDIGLCRSRIEFEVGRTAEPGPLSGGRVL
jgi:uncharacterized protein YjiS (DUF1127 family)